MSLLISLLIAPALAGTLEVPLKDQPGALYVPSSHEVGLAVKGPGEEDKASWENTESNALSAVCGTEGSPPTDQFVEQLMFQVGEQKWALAPGASVQLSCPEGKPVTIVDLHGTQVASFKSTVTLTVTKAKPRAAR